MGTENVIDAGSGLAQQAEAVRSGLTTAEALTQAAITAIEDSQETLNAFRVVRADEALAEARRLDADAQLSELPLAGVPIAVKDDVDVAGESTPFGCAGDFPVVARDSEVVRRLRAAGAIIVGKTNAPEFGQWPFTVSSAYGYTRNPWNRAMTVGGSSGGSAAAVSAGLVPAALASDGGGSIRIPASWTNLVGIKPQRGRVSTWPEAESYHGLTVYGPLARTVADAALLLDAVSGSHVGDLHQPNPVNCLDAVGSDPGKLRIGVALAPPFFMPSSTLHDEVRAGVDRVVAALREIGHVVTVREISYGPLVGMSFFARAMAEVSDRLGSVPDPALADPRTLRNARSGRMVKGFPLTAIKAAEGLIRRQVGMVFGQCDIVLTPTTAVPPPTVDCVDGLGGWETDRFVTAACPYTFPWNVVGWPAVAVPAGFTPSGLPVGAQLLGQENSEPLLVAVASQLESVLGWEEVQPQKWW
ncbi:MAG: amidase [Rhodococcus sp.]|nr:amidase [Rhodococcus sp. (in: high G+C Gram-positive bacteria)]